MIRGEVYPPLILFFKNITFIFVYMKQVTYICIVINYKSSNKQNENILV